MNKLIIKYIEIKDVLVVEENVGHRKTRRDFSFFFLKKEDRRGFI